MKRLLLCLCLLQCMGLWAGLRISLPNGKQIDLYSDYYALVIGNSDYSFFPKLRGVKQDVQDVKLVFEAMGIPVRLMENLSGAQMQRALNDFIDLQGKDPNRALILYYAGHGYTEKRADGSDLGYIVPIDAPLYEKNPGEFRSSAVSMTKINEMAELVRSKHVLLMFDSCFSGTLFSARRAVPQIIDEKTSLPVRQFITAGAANEAVPDVSVFKNTFVKGLGEGFADLNRDGYVTGEELGSYLENEVVNYSRGLQHPKYGKITNIHLDQGDFVFALAKQNTQQTTPKPTTPTPRPKPEETSAELEMLSGDLRILADFETEVFINRKSQGKIKPGFVLNIRNHVIGKHVVEVFTNVAKLSYLVEVKENQVTNLEIKQSVVSPTLKKFIINSNPNQAVFTVEGYTGLSLHTPYIFYEALPDKYKLTFSRKRFADTITEISTNGTESTTDLIPLFGSLKIESDPIASTVMIGNLKMGNTPMELGGEEKGLDPGKYTLRVIPTDENYAITEKQIVIEAGVVHSEQIKHEYIGASLQIVADYYPIAVTVNGTRNSQLEKKEKLLLKPGEVEIRVRYTGTDLTFSTDYYAKLTLASKEAKVLRVELKTPNRKLNLVSNQPKTIFEVTDTSRKLNYGGKGNTNLELPVGNYAITAGKWGYYTQSSPLELVSEAKPLTKEITLQALPVSVMKPHNKWKSRQNVALALMAATLGASLYTYTEANNAYDTYKAANNPRDALQTREDYQAAQKVHLGTFSTAGISTLWTVYSAAKKAKYAKQVKTEMKARLGK